MLNTNYTVEIITNNYKQELSSKAEEEKNVYKQDFDIAKYDTALIWP